MGLASLRAWLGTRHARVAIFYCYAYVMLGAIVASLGPVLPELGRRTNVTISSDDATGEGGGLIGVLTTSRGLGYVVGSFGSGALIELRPQWGNMFIAGSLMLSGIGTLVITQLSSFAAVCAVLAACGLAMGTLDVGANVLIVREFLRPVDAEPYMQALHASFAVGAAVTPVFVTQLMLLSESASSFNLAFALLCFGCVPGFVLGLVLHCRLSPTGQASHGHEAQRGDLTKAQRWMVILVCGAILCLYVGGEVCTGLYMYVYARTVMAWQPGLAGAVNTFFWSCFAVGRVASVFLSAAKVGPRAMLWASLLSTCLFSCVMIGARWMPAGAVGAMLWLAAGGIGASMAPTFPTVFNFASTYLTVTGKIASFFAISASVGEMLVPLVVGALFSVPWIGVPSLFPSVAVCAFAGLLLAVLVLVFVRKVPILDHVALDQVADDNDLPLAGLGESDLEDNDLL